MQYKGSESTTKPNKKRNKNQYEKSIVADFMSHKNVSDRSNILLAYSKNILLFK